MNTRIISAIGVGIAVLVGGWAYYAVLSTMLAQAPAAAPATTALSGPMATIAAHQAATNALLSPPVPSVAPGNAPVDPNAPGTLNPGEVGPPVPGPGEVVPAPVVPPKRPPGVEKWDFDLEKKPIPIDVK